MERYVIEASRAPESEVWPKSAPLRVSKEAPRRHPSFDTVTHVAGGVQIPHIMAQFALIFSHLVRVRVRVRGWVRCTDADGLRLEVKSYQAEPI